MECPHCHQAIPNPVTVHVYGVPQMREVPNPIQGTAWPSIKAAFPLSEAAWMQMIAVLTAMKPGLVEDPKPDPPQSEAAKEE